MTTDSLRVIDEDFVRRIHGHRPSGRLHKGHNVTAATSSIPSKYQTVVIDNSEAKGFLSRSRRFQYDTNSTDNPGPGSYRGNSTSAEKISASFSKKGTGSFASKDSRITKHQSSSSPGAAAYILPSKLVTRKDYNRAANTSSFHKPIAQPRDKIGDNPAPNQYDIFKSAPFTGRANNVTAQASFKSKSRRELLNLKEAQKQPAPWQYEVNDSFQRDSVKVPLSSFKSKTIRQMQPDPPAYPGPGTYKPFEETDPVKKTTFPRKHYLCISAPAMPLPSTPPLPGPGSYEVIDYEGPAKHFMSSAAFVSTTSRWTGEVMQHGDMPGPAHYRPSDMGKQSFMYNATSKWI